MFNNKKKVHERTMTNYTELIKKYYRNDGENMTATPKITSAERSSNEYHRKVRQAALKKHRHLILDELINEIPFRLTEPQILQIRYWIDNFNDNFKNFHRKSSNETIILAFIMIQRKKVNPKIQVERFTISRKYNLTHPVFETIQNRLIFELMRTTQLVYNQSRYYNHEILKK